MSRGGSTWLTVLFLKKKLDYSDIPGSRGVLCVRA